MRHIALPHRGVVSALKTTSATASIGLIGGIALQTITNELLLITPLFIALPAINAMAGDYATVATAHIGDPEISRGSMRRLVRSLLVAVPISTVGVVGLSLLLAVLQGFRLQPLFAFKYMGFVLVSLGFVVGVTVLSSFLLNKALIKHLLNSDDILIPVSNVMASVLILLSITIAAWRVF